MLWLILIAVVVGAILLYAASRPDTLRVERSTTIAAPPEKIFPMLNDFRAWMAWSPWEKLDPAMQRTHSGADSGPGAAYAWSGNSKAGAGHMEIISSTPPRHLAIQLDFEQPFKASNTVDLTLTSSGGGTQLSWVMQGPSSFMSKVFSLFMNMDKMIGKDFEAGLANIRRLAEQP